MDREDQSLATWLRAMRFLGVAPYRSLRLLQTSRPFALYSRILFFCYGAVVLFIMIRNAQIETGNPAKWEAIGQWLVISILLIYTISILYLGMFHSPRRMRQTFCYWKHVKKINQIVGRVATADPAQQQMSALLAGAQLALVLLYAADVFIQLKTNNDFHVTLSFIFLKTAVYSIFFLLNAIIAYFVLVAMKISSPFRRINEQLIKIDSEILSNNKNLVIKKLRSLACAFVSTCGLVRQHNSSEEILLLTLLFCTVVNLATSVYYIVTEGVYNNNLGVLVIESMRYILHTARGMLMATPWHKMDNEVRRTRNLICKLMSKVRDTDVPVLAELEVFHIHLSANQPSYTILGMFTLNRPIIITTMAFVTTGLAFFE